MDLASGDEGLDALNTAGQRYDPTPIINELRGCINTWRALPNPQQWQVTPETARLLQHTCVTTSAPPAAPTSSIDNPSDRFPRF